MVRYTLKQLYYFKAVAEHGGIAQASRALSLSQPAIAQALNKLEQQYGLTLLLRRHSRGVELTSHGRQLYQMAQELLQRAEQQESVIKLMSQGKLDTIRLGCFHTLAPFYMIPLIQQLKQQHANIAVLGEELLQDRLLDKLLNKQLDLAVSYDMGVIDNAISKQKIASQAPYILLSRHHPLATEKSLWAEQLQGLAFVMFDGAGSQDYYHNLLTSLQLAPEIALVSQSMETVRSAVGNQMGFSITVMRPKTNFSYDGSELAYIPLLDPCPELAIVLLRLREQKPTDAMNLLLSQYRNLT
ncbi:MAG: LysR family transcriptional regulator [Gammaproteobacteria bacterium]|jgi:DNA-binding transcriptional LysR family regulator|nr:LysR family transcriptional regulator [Gammaproteobacteria bacterium]